MTLINTKLKNNLKNLIDSNVVDILLFGSVARGKFKPIDTDILIIFEKKIDKEMELKIKKEIEKFYKNVLIVSKNTNTVFEDSFDARESVLFEGISLIENKIIAEKYGFTSIGMFNYETKNLTNLQKTKFYYTLNGRKSSGLLKKLNCVKLSDNIILSPLDKIDELKDFFEFWKIDYKYIPTMIPSRMKKVLL